MVSAVFHSPWSTSVAQPAIQPAANRSKATRPEAVKEAVVVVKPVRAPMTGALWH